MYSLRANLVQVTAALALNVVMTAEALAVILTVALAVMTAGTTAVLRVVNLVRMKLLYRLLKTMILRCSNLKIDTPKRDGSIGRLFCINKVVYDLEIFRIR